MIAELSAEPIPSGQPIRPPSPSPLPIPDYLRGHGMVKCLHAIGPLLQAARATVREGARRLVESHPDAPFDAETVEEALAVNLAEPLLTMMTRVMILELNVARLEDRLQGATPRERFDSFLSGLETPAMAEELLEQYPALLPQIVNRLNQWTAFSLEFLRHISSDWHAIRETFFPCDPGLLVSIRGGAGDTHKDGRSVMIASFSGGVRLVYKPRSLAADEHFQELLAWLNGRGAEPRFRLLKTLERGSHGWVEFIANEPCQTAEEVYRFYRRQGAYVAILYALEASDFHCENLIASGENPMLIDLEALFHPRLDPISSNRADYVAGRTLGYSALRVGLLPQRFWANEEHDGVDMSGLGSAAGQLTPSPVPQWEHSDTDEMCLVRRRVEMPGSDNRPTWKGDAVNAFDYAEAIAGGFSSMYRTLLKHREELLHLIRCFSDDEVRVILRATQTYSTLLHESFHPDVLRDQRDRDALFDRLNDAAEFRPALKRVIPTERADMLQGDVPLFTTRPCSRHLWTSGHERIDNYFGEPGLALVESRIQQLSEADLERQLWIVRASIATLASSVEGPVKTRRASASNREIGPRQFLSAARGIGDRIEELALHGDGEVSWIGLVAVDDHQWRLAPLGPDLYDGLAGMVLFLAYLGDVTEDRRYTALANSALQTLRGQTEDNRSPWMTGGFIGWGGLIYTFSHLASLWSDPSLRAEAERMADRVPGLISSDKHLDIIGGAAGCVLALDSLYRSKPSGIAMRAALACGHRLLETSRRFERGIGWVQPDLGPAPITGFAHGNAGIAYALLKLFELTGEPRFASAAGGAMEYERALFSAEQQNWPDLRERRTADFLTAWCHGAPGIGLARLCSLRSMDDQPLRREIDAALDTTLQRGFGGNHTLCHGDLGNLELLVQAARILHEPQWKVRADGIAAAILADVPETGWVCGNPLGLESPGLMTGLAGIGYELLRLAEPARLPSVLALERPIGL